MKGQICVVTGATDGIGRVTAQALAQKGAHVVLVGRNADKGATVAEAIERTTGAVVESETADLSLVADIQGLAGRLRARLPRVDVLVNNAGAIFERRQLSSDGIEMTFALNHLGYFHLTGLMLALVKESPAARIVNVSSMAHRGRQVDFDNLGGERRYSGWRAYQQSKLANVLYTYRLAETLEGSSVVSNCLHPGFVASSFGRNNKGWLRWGMAIAQHLMAISEEAGARTSIHLASAPDVAGVNGGYFVKCLPAKSSPESHDRAAQARLWEVSEELTGCRYP